MVPANEFLTMEANFDQSCHSMFAIDTEMSHSFNVFKILHKYYFTLKVCTQNRMKNLVENDISLYALISC